MSGAPINQDAVDGVKRSLRLMQAALSDSCAAAPDALERMCDAIAEAQERARTRRH